MAWVDGEWSGEEDHFQDGLFIWLAGWCWLLVGAQLRAVAMDAVPLSEALLERFFIEWGFGSKPSGTQVVLSEEERWKCIALR